MKTSSIISAINALKQARAALRGGGLTVSQEIELGNLCAEVHIQLEAELTAQFPRVALED